MPSAAYTDNELAEIQGVHRSTIARRAEREEWQYMWEKGRGGASKRYLFDLLPEDVRGAILDTEKIDALVPARHQERPATTTDILPESQLQQAQHKADLLRIYMQALATAPWGGKAQARDGIMAAYNSGIAYPTLFKELGELSWKTIEGWKKRLERNKGDTLHLADRRGYHKKGYSSLVTQQTDILLRCVLHPNRPRIAEAIRLARSVMKTKQLVVDFSDATARRWLKKWAAHNHHVWTWMREGAKAWNDKCAYYIERDYSLINVGDILVADGHTLNFDILNPWTGKPQRMTLILFMDMKSNMPVGWEIMPTENTQAISSALRRAIINLGKLPRVIYLDNGRAFRAKHFSGCKDFSEAGFAGLYERLGCQVIHAWPYHGQSKPVERFFGTFAELERWCPTYTGTSIEMKPPRLNRGEKMHRKLYEKQFGDAVITMEQAHRAIAAWFDEYAQRPQRGHLDGQLPGEMFLAGRGQGIDKAALTYLMMSLEIKHIHRNGVTFRGKNYYHPALSHRRHPVTIRYDLQDLSAIYVFDQDGAYLCEAMPVEGVHPAAGALGNDADRERLVLHIEHKRHQEKEASSFAREMLENEVLPQHRRQLEEAGVLEAGQGMQSPTRRKKAKVVQIALTSAEEEEIEAEAAAMMAEASDTGPDLTGLSDADRYDALLEREAQGAVSKDDAAFMRYFEATEAYEKELDYWEERRMVFAVMYQTAQA